RNGIEGKKNRSFVQKRDFLSQMDMNNISVFVFFFTKIIGSFHIPSQNRKYTDYHSQCNSDEQIGKNHCYNRYDKGSKLIFSPFEKVSENGRFCQFVTNNQKDSSQSSQRNF